MIFVNSKLNQSEAYEIVLLPNKILSLLNDELVRAIGESATSELNFEQGKKVGESMAQGYFEKDFKKIKIYLKKLIKIGYLSGVNSKNTEIKMPLKNKVVFTGKSLFDSNNKKSYSSNNLYIVGELVGFISTLTNKQWKGYCSKSISKGDKVDQFIIEMIK
jgi:hypothetical protein